MTTLTIYTTPDCQQCTASKRWLTNRSIPFESVDITQTPAAAELVKGLGYKRAPILIVTSPDGDQHWGGFRPDLLALHAPVAAA